MCLAGSQWSHTILGEERDKINANDTLSRTVRARPDRHTIIEQSAYKGVGSFARSRRYQYVNKCVSAVAVAATMTTTTPMPTADSYIFEFFDSRLD